MELSASWGRVALASILLLVPTWEWLSRVSDVVPEPYLDEVFHVRQAQVYCAGDFHVWDPKITTPPGLYILSYLVFRVTGSCDIFVLRALNCTLALFVSQVSFSILSRLYGLLKPIASSDRGRNQLLSNAVHTAFNICLFPPLFFFYGLYYTDVPSTFFVLFCHLFALRTQSCGSSTILSGFITILLGIAALSFRQTNIFWVAIFPAGLSAVQALKKLKGTIASQQTEGATFMEVFQSSWKSAAIFDVPVQKASIEDYLKTILSLGVAAARNPITVALAIWPYISLLGFFGGLVLWNGGVVLGDKSNHVATLHLPQMLYIWPYILFFSFPILLPTLLASAFASLPQSRIPPQYHAYTQSVQPLNLPRLWLVASFTLLAAVTVHVNTIVHPFTLADNRHYVFYVFRILRAHPVLMYLAAPVYILCGWIVLQGLGASAPAPPKPAKPEEGEEQHRKNEIKTREEQPYGAQTSFLLIWLATTTLNLVSAPLVEPRYFIVPWLLWRLHIPLADTVFASTSRSFASTPKPNTNADPSAPGAPASDEGKDQASMQEQGGPEKKTEVAGAHGRKLWAETVWFLVVNVGAGYVFLRWGFEWPQEVGRVQRFMW